jgi:hypothetical protein
MERSYELQPNELQQQQALNEENQQALAQFGSLTLQMETLRARLPKIEEKQRELVNQVAQRHGVTHFLAARIVNRSLICLFPDEPVAPEPVAAPAVRNSRANGPEHHAAKE